jgi:hypothetical protein
MSTTTNIKSEILQEIERELGKPIAEASARELLSVAMGKPRKAFAVSISQKLHLAISYRALSEGLQLNEVLVLALLDYLDTPVDPDVSPERLKELILEKARRRNRNKVSPELREMVVPERHKQKNTPSDGG